jgi:hypothetical protein
VGDIQDILKKASYALCFGSSESGKFTNSKTTNTEFADEAFKGCYNLQQLVLPEGLQKVSYMMVAGCVNLQSINIPASVEEIEQRAFEDCRSIKRLTHLPALRDVSMQRQPLPANSAASVTGHSITHMNCRISLFPKE